MAKSRINGRSMWGAVALGGVVAALAWPRVRRSLLAVGGTRFTAGVPGASAPHVDPARARPA
jgi:hypothetical protein